MTNQEYQKIESMKKEAWSHFVELIESGFMTDIEAMEQWNGVADRLSLGIA